DERARGIDLHAAMGAARVAALAREKEHRDHEALHGHGKSDAPFDTIAHRAIGTTHIAAQTAHAIAPRLKRDDANDVHASFTFVRARIAEQAAPKSQIAPRSIAPKSG